jgi:hypothetical protein
MKKLLMDWPDKSAPAGGAMLARALKRSIGAPGADEMVYRLRRDLGSPAVQDWTLQPVSLSLSLSLSPALVFAPRRTSRDTYVPKLPIRLMYRTVRIEVDSVACGDVPMLRITFRDTSRLSFSAVPGFPPFGASSSAYRDFRPCNHGAKASASKLKWCAN